MNRERKKRVLRDNLKKNRHFFILMLLLPLTELGVFLLYGLLTEAALYAAALSLVIALVLLSIDLARDLKRADERERLLKALPDGWNEPFEAETLEEEDWHKAIETLGSLSASLSDRLSETKKDTLDYVSAWVHQIKTPIAVMRLQLGGNGSAEHSALLAELSRVEQYVDMVLQYARLESESRDLVIREYPLDELIRESIRRFARQFILKKLPVVYEGTSLHVITDQKWFCCVLEQLLSNAVKYTSSGQITVRADPHSGTISVTDTGVGIPQSDLPRIFEKGYTGMNGREGQNSSGLGLYLCARAAGLLHIRLKVESAPGQGSTFYVILPEECIRPGIRKDG